MTLTRREALKLAGVAAATPLLPSEAIAAAAAAAPAAGRFFTAPEMALLDVVTEMIIPKDEHSGGARAANVVGYIDGRLAEFDPAIPDLRAEREKWKRGLAVMDELSHAVSGGTFVGATGAQRMALMETLAKELPQEETPTEEPSDRGKASEEKPETIGQRFFVELKNWTVRGYYSSKVGIHDELEYKGNVLLVEFSGTDVATLPPIRSSED